jgi:KDO transferase-3
MNKNNAGTMHDTKKLGSRESLITAKKYFRNVYIRLCKPRAYWHNRKFHPFLDIVHEAPAVYAIFWKKKLIAHATAASTLTINEKVCNIIASGSSINEIKNPRLLFNNKTICVNGSFAIARDVGTQPDYYMVCDKGFIHRQFEFFKLAALNSGEVVLNATAINTLCAITPLLLKKLHIIYYEDLQHPFKKCRLKKAQDRRQKKFEASLINHSSYNVAFSKDLSLGIFSSGTVVYNAIQFAYGIGFKELCIFGMDLSSSGRFYPEEVQEPSALCESYESSIKPAFELVKQYADEKHLTIFNCSPQSRLPDAIIRKMDPNTMLELANKPAVGQGH